MRKRSLKKRPFDDRGRRSEALVLGGLVLKYLDSVNSRRQLFFIRIIRLAHNSRRGSEVGVLEKLRKTQ
jgi:hypothetical protein